MRKNYNKNKNLTLGIPTENTWGLNVIMIFLSSFSSKFSFFSPFPAGILAMDVESKFKDVFKRRYLEVSFHWNLGV